MTRWLERGALVAALTLGGTAAAAGQGSLAEAAERTRQAWLAHDAAAVVGEGSSLVLQIPGADPSAPVDRTQAVVLVRRYLQAAGERGLELRGAQEMEPGRGYAELERRYVVAGTADVRRETIFLGFHKTGDAWQLAELRCTP
ncbi:MAG TPA: hypothetical protein VEU55_09545 [Gemmatimonadales bacterium]|nr:hypothetical protein [Gemmatimonadales bacterium]